MIHNLNSIDRVINKIITDLGLGQTEVPYQNFIEWIADALEHIGSYYQFEEKSCNIMIEDYTGMLPCDFHKPIKFEAGCSIEPGHTGFFGGSLQSTLSACGVDYECLPAYERFHIVPVAGLQRADLMMPHEISNRLQRNNDMIGDISSTKFTEMDYNINFNKVTTAFRHGVIQLRYLAMPVDDRGFPLIPDDVSFRDALFWKCAMHISMLNPMLIKNPQLRNYEMCEMRWLKYCGQARASANMPDLETIERLKNNWLRLHNNVNFQDSNYRQNGKAGNTNLNGRI
jgi:hypothetical protein